jgi:hypothetical protein
MPAEIASLVDQLPSHGPVELLAQTPTFARDQLLQAQANITSGSALATRPGIAAEHEGHFVSDTTKRFVPLHLR